MTAKDALEILGLPDGADVAAVHAAHRRLMRMVDPDTGGSPYLAARLDQARDSTPASGSIAGGFSDTTGYRSTRTGRARMTP